MAGEDEEQPIPRSWARLMANGPRRGPRSVIAMRYDLAKDRAPKVVAKGKGVIADKILELAKKHNVPVHQDPELLEALARLDVQEEIPAQLYQVMAEVLTFIYKANKKKVASLPKK